MQTSIVVPYNPGNGRRDRNWAYVRARYEHLYPSWSLVEQADPGPGEWSKGRAVHAGVARTHTDMLIIADADVIVGVGELVRAVYQARQGAAAWVVPHDTVYRLNDTETERALSLPYDTNISRLPAPKLERQRHRAVIGGGIVVCSRAAYDRVGGIDPRFTMWGGEDLSFGRALDTLVGQHAQMRRSPMWHLFHQRMPRRPGNRASEANEELAGKYIDAEGDPIAMSRLVASR